MSATGLVPAPGRLQAHRQQGWLTCVRNDPLAACPAADRAAQRTPSHLWLCRLSRQAGCACTNATASS